MKTIAIAMQKGGVGKTTTAINLGAGLAANGYKTLIIDLDSQCNATNTLLNPKQVTTTLADVLVGDENRLPLKAAIYETPLDNLDLIPAHIKLAKIERFIELEEQFRLKDALATLTDYDVVLLDCPPNLGMTLTQALLSANQVLIPMAADYYSHDGVEDLQETIQRARRGNPALSVFGYLVTRFDARTRIGKQSLKMTQEKFGDLVFQTVIPELAAIKSAPAKQLTVYEFAPDSEGAASYTRFTKEFITRLDAHSKNVLRVVDKERLSA